MSDKDHSPNEDALDDFDAIMQNVSSQLTDDIFDVTSRNMDDDLDAIAGKLADDTELNLDDLDGGPDIDLLEGSHLPPFADDSSRLSYEDPDDHYVSSRLVESRKEVTASQPPPTKTPPEPPEKHDDNGFLDDEDPMLLLDEEINVDKDAHNGGILAIAALVLALIGAVVAGTATWLTLDIKGQLSELATQLSQPAASAPDSKLQELETRLTDTAKLLAGTQSQLHATEATLKGHGDRLDLMLAEGKRGDEPDGRLETVEKQIIGMNTKLDATETSIGQTRVQLERQQEQLRMEFNTRFNSLSTNPPPRPVTASTDPAAVKAEPAVVASTDPTRVKQPPVAQVESTAAPKAKQPQAAQPAIQPKPAPEAAPAPKPGKGAGAWVVNLASYTNERDASNIMKKLQKQGIFPQTRRVEAKGQTWYRLYVDGFANQDAAQRYVKTVQKMPELKQAWAGRAD